MSPLTKILMVMALLVKLHLLASLKMVDACSEGFFILLLYFHKMAYGCVDIRVTYFNHNKSLISSQEFPDMIASVIMVHVKPFNLA